MAKLEARITALEHKASDLRNLSDEELVRMIARLNGVAWDRMPSPEEVAALLPSFRMKPHDAQAKD